MKPTLLLAAALLAANFAADTPALAQTAPSNPDAMAVQPDPHDFVTRTDGTLNSRGNPFRFGGLGLSTLALRGWPGGADLPSSYETTDLLDTAAAMGDSVARSLSMGASAGCRDCIMPSLGKLNETALRRIDHLLKMAADYGIRLVIPLSGGGDSCPTGAPRDPVRDTACVFTQWRGKPATAFYTDPTVRADFTAYITAILQRVNTETGLVYRNDPTIIAWENCDGCGRTTDPAVLADWTEFLGRQIKAVDKHHLYENGAFAGRLASIGTARLALPSVDILGDRLAGTPGAGATRYSEAADAVADANRAYVIDSYDWTTKTWSTQADLDAFNHALRHYRAVTGAFVSDVYGHAEQGGYVKAPATGLPPLYFPGFAIAGMDAETVQNRARAARRLDYYLAGLLPVAFAHPNPPEIIRVSHGKVAWRGSAGALNYSIQRTNDVTSYGSWQTQCDKCAADTSPVWQDPAVPATPTWYRMIPYNANEHDGLPSTPVANQ